MASLDLRDLADNRTNSTGGGRDHDSFASFGLADIKQSKIGSRADNGKCAKGIDDRNRTGIIHLVHCLGGTDLIVCPYAQLISTKAL